MNQNEIIRINIDIDDRDIRNLDGVIRDFNGTLSDLTGALSGSVGQVQESIREFGLLDGAVGLSTGAFDLFERGLRLATIPLTTMEKNIDLLIGKNLLFQKKLAGTTGKLREKKIASLQTATATGILGASMKALPIIGTIALIASLATTIARLVPNIGSSTDALMENLRSMERLSSQYNRSGDDMIADMARMGLSTRRLSEEHLEAWEAVEIATQEAADTFGLCADQVRGEIQDLVYHYGDHEQAIASWNATQMEAVQEVADEWNMCATEVVNALGEMDLDDFVAEQERNLTALADEWGMCTERMRGYMNDQGKSVDELSAHLGQAWDTFNADVNRNVDGITNGFRKIPAEYGKSAEELREIMEHNLRVTANWRKNMERISGEVPDGMMEWLEAKGPEFASVVEEMLNCEDELAYWIDMHDRATQLGTHMALENVDCDDIHDAIVNRLDHEAQAVADHTGYVDAYAEKFERANEVAIGEIESGEVEECLGSWLGRMAATVTEDTGIEDAYDSTFEKANIKALSKIEADDIRSAMEQQLAETAATVSSYTGISEGYNSMLTRANAEATELSRAGGQQVGDTFVSQARSADYASVPNTINNTMQAGQESMVEPVRQAMATMESTMSTGMASIQSVSTTAFSGLGSQIRSSMSEITSTTESSVSGVKRVFSQMSTDLQTSGRRTVTTVQNMARDMQSAMNGIDSRFTTIGRNIADGLRNGILSREGALMATVQRIADNITRTMQRAMQINSPSRVMRDKVGRPIPEGIAAGIDKYADKAIDSIQKLGNDLININVPSVEEMINMKHAKVSLMATKRQAQLQGVSNSVTNNNKGLFDGANIHWHNQEDIRRTMEKMARATQADMARMW